MSTFLQLAPDQGGSRFGPFPGGTIQLGSDQGQCQIVLGGGVAPVHAMIVDHANGTYTIQPAQRGLQLFLQGSGGSQLRPVESAVKASHGDTIVVGPIGARFTLQYEAPKKGASSGAVASGPVASAGSFVSGSPGMRRIQQQGGFGAAMANEASRQMRAKLIAKTPLNDFYSMYYRFRSGAYMQPRYILGAIVSVVVLLGGALVSCFGFLTALVLGQ